MCGMRAGCRSATPTWTKRARPRGGLTGWRAGARTGRGSGSLRMGASAGRSAALPSSISTRQPASRSRTKTARCISSLAVWFTISSLRRSSGTFAYPPTLQGRWDSVEEIGLRSVIRRNWRRWPGYLARRTFEETRRRFLAGRIRHAIASVGSDSLRVDPRSAAALLYSPDDRDRLRELYGTVYRSEREMLRFRLERVLDHEFDILGSGLTNLGPEIDWHRDFKSGRRWDLRPSARIDYAELDQPSDVRVVWELSRCHQLVTLGQAWVVLGQEEAPREFERQIRSWIVENPVGLGVNWAVTMEVAIRAVNWIWAAALMADAPLPDHFRETLALEVYRHGLWISRHLELSEVKGNHFDAEALGLIACGAFCRDSAQGREWMEQGSSMLEREIGAQVEADGVNIEASTQYHRLVLEIFFTASCLLEAAGRPVSEAYRLKLSAMLDYVHGYVPDGGPVPVIGDADDGRVLTFSEISFTSHKYLLAIGAAAFGRGDWKERAGGFWEDALWLMGPGGRDTFEALEPMPAHETRCFAESGYYVLRTPRHYLFVVAAPAGFRGLGGHGHNDCLSFEWHVDDKPMLTDSGLFVYTASPEWRELFRSTGYHNTIRIDGYELNRPLELPTLSFLGNDAEPTETRYRREGEKEYVESGHRRYHRLADPVTVYRSFEVDRLRPVLRLQDRIQGGDSHLVECFFHAAPGAEGVRDGERALEFRWNDGATARIEQIAGPGSHFSLREGWYAPSYGVKVARPVLVASIRAKLPIEVTWELTARTLGAASFGERSC